jgi:transcriptional pleiotropic regulator of transition state genes
VKVTGIVRRLDTLGRIVIPVELRRRLDLADRDSLEVLVGDDGEIVLRKYAPFCIFCGKSKDSVVYHGRFICRSCAKELKELA